MTDGVGTDALDLVAASGKWSIQPGLSPSELDGLARGLNIVFADDHRDFLAAGVPVGPSWPDWRGEETALRLHLGLPARELLRAVGGDYWPASWGPRPTDPGDRPYTASSLVAQNRSLVPVYGHAFMGAGCAAVWSVDGGTVTHAGADLLDFANRLCGHRRGPVTTPESAGYLKFWTELLPAGAPGARYPALGSPPFTPDPPAASGRAVAPPADPRAAYTDLGIELADLARHDDLLAHGGPLWTVRAEPGERAITQWRTLRRVFDRTGLWPVLITPTVWHRIGPDNGALEDAALLSAPLDGAGWLADEARRREAEDEFTPPRAAIADEPADGMSWWNEWAAFMGPDHEYDTVALVSSPAPWYVPGLLQWSGAANYDVAGPAHAAVLRRWFGRWGAELVSLEDESMTLRVEHPPAAGPDALQAAFEMYLYCPDSVEQGADSVDALARMTNRRLWYLWWD